MLFSSRDCFAGIAILYRCINCFDGNDDKLKLKLQLKVMNIPTSAVNNRSVADNITQCPFTMAYGKLLLWIPLYVHLPVATFLHKLLSVLSVCVSWLDKYGVCVASFVRK